MRFLKIRYKLPKEETSRLIEPPITRPPRRRPSTEAATEARFATAVAAFGQLLRGEPHTRRASATTT